MSLFGYYWMNLAEKMFEAFQVYILELKTANYKKAITGCVESTGQLSNRVLMTLSYFRLFPTDYQVYKQIHQLFKNEVSKADLQFHRKRGLP